MGNIENNQKEAGNDPFFKTEQKLEVHKKDKKGSAIYESSSTFKYNELKWNGWNEKSYKCPPINDSFLPLHWTPVKTMEKIKLIREKFESSILDVRSQENLETNTYCKAQSIVLF